MPSSATAFSLAELARGAQLVLENAEALHEEGRILGQNGRFSRALVLHQISMEECGKIDLLGGWATSIFLHHEIDAARVVTAFRSHKAKNFANAYFATAQQEEREARERGDTRAAMEAFRAFQKRFHNEVNDAKNAGLYVDCRDGQFFAPCDTISEDMAAGMEIVNAYFLRRAGPMARVVDKMAKDSGELHEMLSQFCDKLVGLDRSTTTDPEKAFEDLAEAFLQHGRSQ